MVDCCFTRSELCYDFNFTPEMIICLILKYPKK